MIKTLLAGAILSTGLVAGGAAGADDVIPVHSKESAETKTKEGTSTEGKLQFAVEETDKDGNITYKEIDETEIPKDVQVEHSKESVETKTKEGTSTEGNFQFIVEETDNQKV
ncbi:hypothetical protein LAV92_22955 [Bacillus cereus]|uniref:hypothetical protein n=1 Tax=Bacillus cereus TaxID=1396 RepID=UPI0023E36B06|nr:hypothetical protein [Bacillus cereus]MDF3554599.1 hypothetical protein [Bacillus cereus]